MLFERPSFSLRSKATGKQTTESLEVIMRVIRVAFQTDHTPHWQIISITHAAGE